MCRIISITNLVYETYEAFQHFKKSEPKNKALIFKLGISYYCIMI